MTIRKSLSTQDYIRIENSVTDNDQHDGCLRATESDCRPDVSNGLDLWFFSIERSFQFSFESPDSVVLFEEFKHTFGYQIAICRIVNLNVHYFITDRLCKKRKFVGCQPIWFWVHLILVPKLSYRQSGLYISATCFRPREGPSLPAMASKYRLREYSAADNLP